MQHNWQKGEKDKISPTTYSYIKILKPTPQKNNNSKCQFPTISHWRKTWFGMSQYLIFVVVSLTWTTVSFSFLIPCQIPSEVLYSLIWGEGGGRRTIPLISILSLSPHYERNKGMVGVNQELFGILLWCSVQTSIWKMKNREVTWRDKQNKSPLLHFLSSNENWKTNEQLTQKKSL